MHILIILIESLIIGTLVGLAVGIGAARMFNAPTVQALGAFRTLGEMNASEGDPASHFSFGLGFFFNAWASTVAAGSFTQDVTHRVIPNWAAALLMLKNHDEKQMHDAKLLINTVMPVIFWLAAIDGGKRSGIFGTVFGGIAQLIMGNAVPGVVLGILVGKGVDESGWNKITKIILITTIVLFILSAFFRGIDLTLFKQLNMGVPAWLKQIHSVFGG